MDRKFVYIGVGGAITAVILGWLLYLSLKPLPGNKQPDLGRQHVDIGTAVEYGSNPPTSGSHYVDWIRAGVYSDVKDDRNLVHSLEHGYIIMSYNCDFVKTAASLIPTAFAQEEASPSAEASAAATLSPNFSSDSCQNIVKKLTDLYDRKGKSKIIVLPRPNLDAAVAFTAWDYLMKFNDANFLDNSNDMKKVNEFIDAHRNNGPERTME